MPTSIDVSPLCARCAWRPEPGDYGHCYTARREVDRVRREPRWLERSRLITQEINTGSCWTDTPEPWSH